MYRNVHDNLQVLYKIGLSFFTLIIYLTFLRLKFLAPFVKMVQVYSRKRGEADACSLQNIRLTYGYYSVHCYLESDRRKRSPVIANLRINL